MENITMLRTIRRQAVPVMT